MAMLVKYLVHVSYTKGTLTIDDKWAFLDAPGKYPAGTSNIGGLAGVEEATGDNLLLPAIGVSELLSSPFVRRYNLSYTVGTGDAAQRKTSRVLVGVSYASAFETKYDGGDTVTETYLGETAKAIKAIPSGRRRRYTG